MKRLICLLLIMFAPLAANDVALSFKVSAFRPTARVQREIFHDWFANYQIELDVPFGCFNKCGFKAGFNAWASFNYFGDAGHSLGLHKSTTIDVYPLTVGVDIVVPLCGCISGYFGGGPRYYWTRIHNDIDCPCVPNRINSDGWGGLVRGGFLFPIICNFWGDIFVDYAFFRSSNNSRHFCYENHTLNLDGVSIGGGFRYRF